jgi:hypothetical protein
MKRIIIIALAMAMVISAGIGSAFAANSLQDGNMSISVGMGDSIFGTVGVDVIDISGRYLITKDMAIIGGFGLRTDGGDADATYLSFTGGVRKYLKTDDFAPFASAQLTIAMEEDDVANTDQTAFDLSVLFGAEYFLGKQFSLEGAVGVGFGQISDDVADADDRYFGTRTVGVKANFYF